MNTIDTTYDDGGIKMICGNCGKTLDDNSMFCTSCGHIAQRDALQNQQSEQPEAAVVLNEESDHYAGWYAGQLDAYTDALESAGEKVIKRYIYYPVSGMLCEISKGFDWRPPYDENVFLYGEEYMLGHTMRLLGYRTALLTNASFLHRHGETIGKSYKKLLERQKLREKSTLYYYKEYLNIGPMKELVTKLFYAAVNLEVRLLAEK